ncbi:hypothetical protein K1T71_008939 [Dendrolimus kikuchii]|uniref:Uncharacterized protein n=1 Tax=Dendrolimus kikuchii TaxID=765133 RepID=A0ACC1CW43_9NEOP|nr:hypothetical protein K1T71_008939 [Dendrolimus kikuchii]
MIYRLIFLSVVLGVAMAGFRENMHKCGRFMRPGGMECCKAELQKKPPSDDLKECFQLPMRPPSCEREICIGKKKGFGNEDGKVDKAAFAAYIDKELEQNADLAKAIKEKCLDGDLTKYGPADMCDLVKVKFCVDIQMIANCPEWDDKGPCAGIKDDVAECLKLFA